jgi:aminoglycoside 2''-phosphotransferase
MHPIIEPVPLLSSFFPDLTIRSIKSMGSGFSSDVYLVNDRLVFRFAKNQETARKFQIEYKLLPLIQPYIPFQIPNPQWIVSDFEAPVHGIIGYEMVPGFPLTPPLTQEQINLLSQGVASFLVSLHQIPLYKFNKIDIPVCNYTENELIQIRSELLPRLRETLTADEYTDIEDWWETLLNYNIFHLYEPRLCHGDLWYENILVNGDRNRITGIIDFGEISLGDPARDLAVQLYLGVDFFKDVYNQYISKMGYSCPHLIQRVKLHWELRELIGLHYCIKHKDWDEFREGIEKIRTWGILGKNPLDHALDVLF